MKLNGAHQEMTGGVMVEDVITYYIYGVVARTCVLGVRGWEKKF